MELLTTPVYGSGVPKALRASEDAVTVSGRRRPRLSGVTRRVALLLTALAAVCWAFSVAWLWLSWDVEIPATSWGFRGFGLLNGIAFTAVGGIVAIRQPKNVIGGLLLANGVAWSLTELEFEYAVYAVAGRPEPLAAGVLAAWLCSWQWTISVGFYPATVVLFPDGRLSSLGRRAVVLATSVVTMLLAFQFAFRPGPLQLAAFLDNPVTPVPESVVVAAGVAALALTVPMGLGTIALLVRRFRRSRGVEREQLKWLAYAALPLVALGPLSAIVPGKPIQILSAIGQLAVPVAIAVAVLRYRLYDIDVLINRTLVYGTLSATLAATYAATVLLLGALLRPLTSGSEVSVAVSTLATLAVVQPLRRRIQGAVDRRFYRSRYDAVRTLDAFSVRLRDEVDLDAVRADLVAAVRDTVQPAHASLWLRAE